MVYKMKRKVILMMMFSIFLIEIVASQGVSYCCERTAVGAWCQNAPENECHVNFRSVPTSCESTSYCRLGTCIDAKQGNCYPNTPQKVCEDSNGVWNEKSKSEIPQCQLGCCLIGDQAAFTTLVRCKQLSSEYGLQINYRPDIRDEVTCITSATPKIEGACVFEKEFERTCQRLTKEECQERQKVNPDISFYAGYLCSAPDLETNCGPSKKTTCVSGKDEVFFLDSCGNLANVYDSSMIDKIDPYWTYISAPTCDDGKGNKNSKTCGNCNYYEGSTCKKAERPNYPLEGDNICVDLGCKYDGKDYQHGETWCASKTDDELINSPGGRHLRLVCYNGDATIEPCAEYRQEICIQSGVGEGDLFKTAACRVNRWQDCFSQENKRNCENDDRRDCRWLPGKEILARGTSATPLTISGLLPIGGETSHKIEKRDYCVPLYAPGFNFWEEENDAESLCSLADDICVVEFAAGMQEGAFLGVFGAPVDQWLKPVGNADCVKECRESCLLQKMLASECIGKCTTMCLPYSCVDDKGNLKESWKEERQELCNSLGDCGSKSNYLGTRGYLDWDASFVEDKIDAGEEEGGIGNFLKGIFGG